MKVNFISLFLDVEKFLSDQCFESFSVPVDHFRKDDRKICKFYCNFGVNDDIADNASEKRT